MNFAKTALCGVLVCAMGSIASAQLVEESTTGNVSLPDGSGVFVGLDLNVGGSGIIEDLDADVLIATTWQGDIVANVISPANTSVTVINRPGSPPGAGWSADNFGNPATGEFFRLDDEAASVYDTGGGAGTPGIANVTGSWIPDGGSLSDFDGEEVNGTWRLEASDNAGLDFASIQGFGISATVPEPATMALLGMGGLVALRRRR